MSNADPLATLVTEQRIKDTAALPDQITAAMLAAATDAARRYVPPSDAGPLATVAVLYTAALVPAWITDDTTGEPIPREPHTYRADAERLAVTAARTLARRLTGMAIREHLNATDREAEERLDREAVRLAGADRATVPGLWSTVVPSPETQYRTTASDTARAAIYGTAERRWADRIRAGEITAGTNQASTAYAERIRSRIAMAAHGERLADGKTVPAYWHRPYSPDTPEATPAALSAALDPSRQPFPWAEPTPDATAPLCWQPCGIDDYGAQVYRLTALLLPITSRDTEAGTLTRVPVHTARIATTDPGASPIVGPPLRPYAPTDADTAADRWAEQQARRSREPGDPGRFPAAVRKPSGRKRPKVGATGPTTPGDRHGPSPWRSA